jgi:hypothetical protein
MGTNKTTEIKIKITGNEQNYRNEDQNNWEQTKTTEIKNKITGNKQNYRNKEQNNWEQTKLQK